MSERSRTTGEACESREALATPKGRRDGKPVRTRVRPLKFVIQSVLVVDDGEMLTEIVGRPVEVPATGWDDFRAEFERGRLAHEHRLNAEATGGPAARLRRLGKSLKASASRRL